MNDEVIRLPGLAFVYGELLQMLFNKITLQTFVFKSNELVNYNNNK